MPGLGLGRDPERTPLQWDASPHAGFSTVQQWLAISPDYAEVNVSSQLRDPQSMLSLYRALLKLRRATAALNVGDYRFVLATDSLLRARIP